MKASELLGRAAVIREGGQKAGKIKDFVIDPSGRRVLGFVLKEGTFSKTRVAPWSGLQTIGPDNVVFNPADSVVSPVQAPEIKGVLDGKLRLRNRSLQTTEGKDLGKITDLHFDDRSGVVLGYELTGGMLSGRRFMPTPNSMEMGQDIVFVAPEVEGTLSKGDGPAKGPEK